LKIFSNNSFASGYKAGNGARYREFRVFVKKNEKYQIDSFLGEDPLNLANISSLFVDIGSFS
jgi:hypothetical protein